MCFVFTLVLHINIPFLFVVILKERSFDVRDVDLHTLLFHYQIIKNKMQKIANLYSFALNTKRVNQMKMIDAHNNFMRF